MRCDDVHLKWQKSSYSTDADGTNCLELARHQGHIWIRESDDPSVALRTTPDRLRALLAHAGDETE